jgi:hypothetical protein
VAIRVGSKALPWSLVLTADVVGTVLSLGPGAVALAAVGSAVRYLWDSAFLLVILLVTPVGFVAVFLATLFLLRLCCPRLLPGRFTSKHRLRMAAWYCHLALSRAAAVAGIKDLIHSFYLTRFLYGRALGAKVGYRVNTAQSIIITDYPLITIGSGSTIGEGTSIGAHSFAGDLLIIRPTTLGKNVFVGKDCIISGGSVLEDDVWVGLGNRLWSDHVRSGTRLRNFEWEHGSDAAEADSDEG